MPPGTPPFKETGCQHRELTMAGYVYTSTNTLTDIVLTRDQHPHLRGPDTADLDSPFPSLPVASMALTSLFSLVVPVHRLPQIVPLTMLSSVPTSPLTIVPSSITKPSDIMILFGPRLWFIHQYQTSLQAAATPSVLITEMTLEYNPWYHQTTPTAERISQAAKLLCI